MTQGLYLYEYKTKGTGNKRVWEGLLQAHEQQHLGKKMENICNHKDRSLITKKNKYLKLVVKHKFKNGREFNENVIFSGSWTSDIGW